MDFNQLFCTVLSSADRYQKLLEDEDKCKILKQDKKFLRNASLAQKSELKTACQVLIENYGLYEMNKNALQKSYDKLATELNKERKKYERDFNELVAAIFTEFSDLPVEKIWPEEFINSNSEPEPLKYYVCLIGFGKEGMFARRAFYRAELKNSQSPITPYDLEMSYMELRETFDIFLPIN